MDYPTYLIHYGTLGQKWGIRKYQNEDGTWTEEGLRRRRQYVSDSGDLTRSGKKYYKKLQKEKDKTQKLYTSNFRQLTNLQNSYQFESESQRQHNDRLFKQAFNKTVKNIEYAKTIDSELSAIGQKYIAKAKGLNLSVDSLYIETNKNGEKTIKFKKEEPDKPKDEIGKSGFSVDKLGYAEKKKNGITYSFDTDENSKEKLGVYKDLEKRMPTIKNDLDKKLNELLKEDLDNWVPLGAKHNIKLKEIYIYDNESADANYWDDGPDDPLGGHVISIEFDPKTGKYRRYSLNG